MPVPAARMFAEGDARPRLPGVFMNGHAGIRRVVVFFGGVPARVPGAHDRGGGVRRGKARTPAPSTAPINALLVICYSVSHLSLIQMTGHIPVMRVNPRSCRRFNWATHLRAVSYEGFVAGGVALERDGLIGVGGFKSGVSAHWPLGAPCSKPSACVVAVRAGLRLAEDSWRRRFSLQPSSVIPIVPVAPSVG